jgi:hypothetical protein
MSTNTTDTGKPRCRNLAHHTDKGQADARQEDQLKSITEFLGGNVDRQIAFQAWIMRAIHRSYAAFTDGARISDVPSLPPAESCI